METDLAVIPGLGEMMTGADVPAPMSDAMRERAAATSFLPILAIVQGLSKAAGPPYNFRLGTWSLRLGTDNYKNFEPELDAIVLDAREKALYIDKSNNVESNFDPTSQRFAEIKAMADAGGAKDGWSWGYDILLLLRDGTFAIWFCNNPTLRRVCKTEYPPLFDCMQKGVTIKPKYLSKDGRNWYGATVTPCSTFESIPATRERLLAVIQEFKNPTAATEQKNDDVQEAPKAASGDR